MTNRRALLMGHFSTVGDIESLETVRHWLEDLDLPYDIMPFFDSVREKLPGCVKWNRVDPSAYSHLVMICGPVWENQLKELGIDLNAFQHCVRIGINLTMVNPVRQWNPFDILLERDSDRFTRPDLTFLTETPTVRVLGRCLVKKQLSYAGRERHEEARQLFDEVARRLDCGTIDLDTRWYREQNGLKSPAQFFSALHRVDLLLTNRLHGLVYALKAGVPVIAIDAIEGGAKVMAQAQTLGWPQCFTLEDATPDRLLAAIEWCWTPHAHDTIRLCQERAVALLQEVKKNFFTAVGLPPPFFHLVNNTLNASSLSTQKH